MILEKTKAEFQQLVGAFDSFDMLPKVNIKLAVILADNKEKIEKCYINIVQEMEKRRKQLIEKYAIKESMKTDKVDFGENKEKADTEWKEIISETNEMLKEKVSMEVIEIPSNILPEEMNSGVYKLLKPMIV